jgi:hypothetical protein
LIESGKVAPASRTNKRPGQWVLAFARTTRDVLHQL